MITDTEQRMAERVEKLERLVYGKSPVPLSAANSHSHGTKPATVVDQLVDFQKQFNEAAKRRDKLQRIVGRITELEKYLDTGFVEEETLSTDVKIQLILAEEANIRRTAEMLSQVKELQSVLDSAHLRDLQSYSERFRQLWQVYQTQTTATDEGAERGRELMAAYCEAIRLVNKQMAQWDRKVTSIERENLD